MVIQRYMPSNLRNDFGKYTPACRKDGSILNALLSSCIGIEIPRFGNR
jgi:hypothetical protein